MKPVRKDCTKLLFIITFVGIPTLAYGLGSWMLVKYSEEIKTSKGVVKIYFLNKEDRNAQY